MDLDPALRAPQAPSAPPRGAASAAMARTEAQLALLDRLAAYGVQLAEAMARQVTPPPGAPFAAPPPRLFQGDIALGFSRVARAVRLTVALHAKLLGELVALDRAASPPGAESALEARAVQEDEAALERERAPETDPPERAEAAEGGERFEREREARDEIDALLDRPGEEVIALICRDLGVSPEWVAQAKAEGVQDLAREREAEMAFAHGPSRERPRPPKPPERWPRPPPS